MIYHYRHLLPATLLVALFILIGVASLAALFLFQDHKEWMNVLTSPYIWRVLGFSLWQALLSAVISIGLAIPLTSVLLHRRFWGREWLLQFFSLSLVVPTLVAILGIVVIYGRNGLVNKALRAMGLEIDVSLYGLFGILLAHVFFNMPLAVRILLQSCSLIPPAQLRLSYQFGFSRWALFRWVEWPYIRKGLPGAFILIFMLCFSSFAVVLSLGGGPKSSTLEVAIYQALRYEFDLSKASILSVLQVLVCTSVAVLVYRFSTPVWQDFSLTKLQTYSVKDSFLFKCFDSLVVFIALLLLLPPFIAIFLPMFSVVFINTLLEEQTWAAIWVSIKIAIPAALLSLIFAFSLAVVARFFMARQSIAKGYLRWIPSTLEHVGNVILMVPSLVMATGLFLLLRTFGLGVELGYYVVVWVNAVMALPFVLRVLLPVLYQQERRYLLVYASLGIRGWQRFLLEWPLVRQAFGQACAYAIILSLGDMGVIALFGSQGLLSLPLYLFQLIGSYRLEQGACVAVLLILLCMLLFAICTRVIGGARAKY